MAKNIIFCADGTWNGPGESETAERRSGITNVLKLYRNLEGENAMDPSAKEQECEAAPADGQPAQIAKYLHGVGDTTNPLLRLFQGSTGAGVVGRIVRGYTFVSRHYKAGDRIYLIGFSRGAYTARALGGMICKMGLLSPENAGMEDKVRAYEMGARVWRAYRHLSPPRHGGLFAGIGQILSGGGSLFGDSHEVPKRVEAEIEAIGVWDTVGALGVPTYQRETGDRSDLFEFADLGLNTKVKHGFHAIATDDQREDFVPTLWDDDPERITQVLFPGAHADVGGGYPSDRDEDGLSDCALAWMTRKLKEVGVRFADPADYKAQPRPLAPAHRPWMAGVWAAAPREPRSLRPGLTLSTALLDRLAAPAVRYDPNRPPMRYLPPNLGSYLTVTPVPTVALDGT